MANNAAPAISKNQAILGELSRKWGWLLALGIIQLILGTIGLGMTFGLTLATILVYGIFLIIGGGFQIVQAFTTRGWKGMLLHLLIAILYVLAGAIIINNPLAASLLLTLVVGFVLLAAGIFRAIIAFHFKGFKNWIWPLMGGISLHYSGTHDHQPVAGIGPLGDWHVCGRGAHH